MEDVPKQVSTLMKENQLLPKDPYISPEDCSSSSSDVSSDDEGGSERHSQKKKKKLKSSKSKRKKKKERSGKSRTVIFKVKFPQRWPQSFLSKELKFDGLTISQFCAEYSSTLEEVRGDERTHRLSHFKGRLHVH